MHSINDFVGRECFLQTKVYVDRPANRRLLYVVPAYQFAGGVVMSLKGYSGDTADEVGETE
jgi:hypothetical protein